MCCSDSGRRLTLAGRVRCSPDLSSASRCTASPKRQATQPGRRPEQELPCVIAATGVMPYRVRQMTVGSHDRREWCHRGAGGPVAPLLAITGSTDGVTGLAPAPTPWPGQVRIAAGWPCSDPVAAGPPCCTPGPLRRCAKHAPCTCCRGWPSTRPTVAPPSASGWPRRSAADRRRARRVVRPADL